MSPSGGSDLLAGARRATDLRPLVAAGGAGMVLVTITGWHAEGDPSLLATAVLPCLGLLAVALATAVDEAPENVLAASPTPLRSRLLARLLVATALMTLVGTALGLALSAWADGATGWSWGGWAQTLAALAVFSVGVAAQGRRWFPDVPGGLVSAAVLAPAALATSVLPTPEVVRAALAHLPQEWATVAATAAGAALLTVATRDRAAQPFLRTSTR